jgi:RNA polymerase sigma-70 factor (ECF subfamily)
MSTTYLTGDFGVASKTAIGETRKPRRSERSSDRLTQAGNARAQVNAQTSANLDRAVPQSSLPNDQFQSDLIALIPHLRAFSRSLCSRRDLAEDLAQEALVKAWRARDSYISGTNLKAWLFTILRNTFYSQGRRAWREAHLDVGVAESIAAPPKEQDWSIELTDVARALRKLPDAQRDAVILVGAGGVSYKDAAKICSANIGTMKSRVARGRIALLGFMEGVNPLPLRSVEPPTTGSDDIFAQLGALTRTDQGLTAYSSGS